MKLFRKNDNFMLKLLIFDNILTLQLVIMSPALTISSNNNLCILITALLFTASGIGFYFISPKLPHKYYKLFRYLPAPLLASAVSFFFTRPPQALMCGALTAICEFILAKINERISASSVRPALRLSSQLLSAAILSMAVVGLRF